MNIKVVMGDRSLEVVQKDPDRDTPSECLYGKTHNNPKADESQIG
jgi:hypothetical protein